MHVDPEGVQFFFNEAKKVLRPGGRLVVSLTHRDIIHQQEVMGLNPGWIWHEPGNWDEDKNVLAVEHYFDVDGKEFIAPSWMHNLRPAAEKAGFKVVEHHDRVVTRESLTQIYGERSAKWPTGYAAFEQILAY